MKRHNIKLIIGFILGAIIFTSLGVTAATILNSREITYDNTNSKLNATNLQEAIDELNNKTKLKNRSNIVEAYTYNQTSGASDYCVTGDENTCVATKCHKSTTAGSCPAGTIIIYKVNENETVRFHVMYDNGTTMTMQSQRNTLYSTPWGNTYTEGPIIILEALENVTAGWGNVNNQTYTMGTTIFKTNAYTGCDPDNLCTYNSYTLEERTAKARMITVQEAVDLGCTTTSNMTCPLWMANYAGYTTYYYHAGVDDTTIGPNGTMNWGYWTMNTMYDTSSGIEYFGIITQPSDLTAPSHGARAVVEINK